MTINTEKLWIGDRLRVRRSGETGYFEGMSPNGFVLFRSNEGMKKYGLDELELIDEKIEHEELSWPKDQKSEIGPVVERVIDLHYEKLFPGKSEAVAQMVLRKQLEACKNFIEKAIHHKLPTIMIIHGIGTGLLRLEVEHLLSKYIEVQFYLSKNEKGATEVWFRY